MPSFQVGYAGSIPVTCSISSHGLMVKAMDFDSIDDCSIQSGSAIWDVSSVGRTSGS